MARTLEDLLNEENPLIDRESVAEAQKMRRRRDAGIPMMAGGPWDGAFEVAAQARRVAGLYDALVTS